MALREFAGPDGETWLVWDTVPASERLLSNFPEGWLTFQKGDERRRLMPIPKGWENSTSIALRTYLARAEPVARRQST